MAGVHPLVENIDSLPLTTAIDTGDEDNYRKISGKEIELGIEKILPELRDLLLITVFVNFVAKLCGFKHELSSLLLLTGASQYWWRSELGRLAEVLFMSGRPAALFTDISSVLDQFLEQLSIVLDFTKGLFFVLFFVFVFVFVSHNDLRSLVRVLPVEGGVATEKPSRRERS
jgi:hypothetical protein